MFLHRRRLDRSTSNRQPYPPFSASPPSPSAVFLVKVVLPKVAILERSVSITAPVMIPFPPRKHTSREDRRERASEQEEKRESEASERTNARALLQFGWWKTQRVSPLTFWRSLEGGGERGCAASHTPASMLLLSLPCCYNVVP